MGKSGLTEEGLGDGDAGVTDGGSGAGGDVGETARDRIGHWGSDGQVASLETKEGGVNVASSDLQDAMTGADQTCWHCAP